MIFKKRKYFIVFVLMIMIVVSAFCLQVYITATAPDPIVPDNGGIEEDVGGNENVDAGDINNPALDNPLEDEELEQEFDPNMPDARYPLKILNYTLDKLYGGAGYRANYVRNITNDAGLMGSSIKVIQDIEGILEASGGKAKEKLKYVSSGAMPDRGANYLRYCYIDETMAIDGLSPAHNYNENDIKYTQMTIEEYRKKYVYSVTERFPLDFSSKYFRATIEPQINKKGVEYYILTATITDTAVFTQKQSSFFEATGDLANVKGVAGNYVFYIYKDSGQIFKINTVEKFSGTNPAFGVGVDTTVTSTYTITTFNTAFEIKKPKI